MSTPSSEEKHHSTLSPSGADKFLACTGSVTLAEKLNAKKGAAGFYADEGSAAHKLFEWCLLKKCCSPHVFLGKKINAHFSVTKEMANAVEVAVDYVRDLMATMDKPVLKAEHEVWISCLDYRGDPGHGTVDVFLYDDYDVHVLDYKHGQGNPVEVEKNKQMMLYAIGELGNAHAGKGWHLHVLQPRCPHPDGPCRKWDTSYKALRSFEKDALTAVKSIEAGKTCFTPGEKQCKYCVVKGRCPALAEESLKAANIAFSDFIEAGETPEADKPVGLTTKQLATAMSRVNLLRLFISAVEEEVFGRLQKGDATMQKFYKLVEGKSNRQWRDEAAVVAQFKKLGLNPDDYAPRKLVGIGAGEDLIPKDKREKIMAKLAHKPTGKAVIATVDDPRKPIRPNSAESDFADLINKE